MILEQSLGKFLSAVARLGTKREERGPETKLLSTDHRRSGLFLNLVPLRPVLCPTEALPHRLLSSQAALGELPENGTNCPLLFPEHLAQPGI